MQSRLHRGRHTNEGSRMGRRLWSSKRALAVGAAALALVAGTGAAVASTGGSSSERDAYLAAAAERLGVSVDKLKEALKGAALERLDAAVAEGRIDAERAAAIRERIQSGEGFFGFGHGFGHGLGGFGFHGLHGPGVFAAAADYLGLDTQALLDKLRSGQSLADVLGRAPVKGFEYGPKGSVKDLRQLKEKLSIAGMDIKGRRQYEDAEAILRNLFQQVEALENEREKRINQLTRGEELPTGVLEMVKVYVATKRNLSVGDKVAGRHGNKGVIARILPE